MLKCRDFAERASDWLEQQLSLGERLRMRAHLLHCRHCQALIDGLQTTRNLVRAHQPVASPQSEQAEAGFINAIDRRLSQVTGEPLECTSAGNDAFLESVQDPEDERVRRVFAEIEQHEGEVPNLFRAYANNPQVLEHNWARVRTLMHEGRLSPLLKQGIAYLVSYDNACRYCLVFHGKLLRELGVTEGQIEAMTRREDYGFLDEKDAALLGLARQANRDAHGTSAELVERVRAAGASEMEIVEALGIMELYCSFNRFLDAVRVPLDSA